MSCLDRRVTTVLLIGCLLGPRSSAQEVPPSPERPAAAMAPRSDPVPPPGPIHIFEAGPLDLPALLQRLAQPDYVILRGAEYDRLRERANEPSRASAPPFVIESVLVAGDAHDNLAELTITFGMQLDHQGPLWVPLGLDLGVLTAIREQDRDRPARIGNDGGWEVELTGRGSHQVVTTMIVPLRDGPQSKALELALPEAAITRIDLFVAGTVAAAECRPGEPLQIQPDPQRHGVRLQASLAPRKRLSLHWQARPRTETVGPPLLTAQGEITVELDQGMLRARATWSLVCERGSARELVLRLPDARDELISLELDDQPLPLEDRHDPETGLVTIPLLEPLQAGTRKRLSLATRRVLTAGSTARCLFEGFPFADAATQSGFVAIVQGADLWASGLPGRGLRTIDPRELPDTLRARPSTVLAYYFVDQPFGLELRVDAARPHPIVESRSTLVIEPTIARLATELDYRVRRVRLQEVRLGLDDAVALEAVGPPEVVESFQLLEEAARAGAAPHRILVVRLNPRGTAEGPFRLRIDTRQPLDLARLPPIGLVRPHDATVRDSVLALLASRELAVELLEPEARRQFTLVPSDENGELPRLPDRLAIEPITPRFVVRSDAQPERLPLRITAQPRSFECETRLEAAFDRQAVDLVQRSRCLVRTGSLRGLEFVVPRDWEGLWDVSVVGAGSARAGAVLASEALPPTAAGEPRYRLTFDREFATGFELRFHLRRPLAGLAAEGQTRLKLPWVRLPDSSARPTELAVTAEPGIELLPQGKGWSTPSESASPSGPFEPRLVWTGTEPPAIELRAAPPAPLPPVVISRLWIRTILLPDGSLQNTFWARIEAHRGTLAVALPTGAVLVSARGANGPLEVELRPGDYGQIVRLEEGGRGATPLRLDYLLPPEAPAPWSFPRLLDGGVVQQTLWECRLPADKAVLGTPGGWSDENQWVWDQFLWKRRPALEPPALVSWIGGPAALGPEDLGGPARSSTYLFGRFGAPASSRPVLAARWVLVGVCSGLALALGLGLLMLRPSLRVVGVVGLGAVLAGAAAIELNALLLLVQSALVGVALTAVAAVTQRLVEQRQPRRRYPEPSGFTPPLPAAGSSRRVPLDAGSEQSTVIRRRASSTIDYAPSAEAGISDGTE